MKSTMMFLIAVAGASALYAQNPLSAELKQQYNGAKRDITNAQIIGHTADIQLAVCAGAKGEQKRGNAEQTKTSKADLVAALKESFDYCDSVVDPLTDATAVQMVKMFGRDQSRLGTLYFDVIHNNEMYGQIVVYYRAKGMTPPSTADRPAQGKKKE